MAPSLSSFSKEIHTLTSMITGNHVGKFLRQARDALTKKQKAPRLIRTQTCPLIELPNEIVFQFLEYMPLQSLISCRLVCSRWRHIVPLANLLPARQQLLQFYISVTNSKRWLQYMRAWLRKPRKEILERDAYIEELLLCFQTTLPDVFVLWMKEWPGHFEIYHRSAQYRSFHLRLFLGRIFVGLAHTKPICSTGNTQHEGQECPCPLVYLERK